MQRRSTHQRRGIARLIPAVVFALAAFAGVYFVASSAQQHATVARDSLPPGEPRAGVALRNGGSVILAFIESRFHGSDALPTWFVLRGHQGNVDTAFTSQRGSQRVAFGPGRSPCRVLGGGLAAKLDSGALLPSYFYRDAAGARLIERVNTHDACERLVLTTESRHAARRHRQNFADLRTGRGVRLGDSEGRLQELLGPASVPATFGEYEILWYLGRPVRVPFDIRFHRGSAAGYALKNGRVVEIYLEAWTDTPAG